MSVIPQVIDRRAQIRKLLWDNFHLSVLVGWFILIILTNMFWVLILLPWGIFTWFMVAQFLYWWIEPRWSERFPRVTKSMLREEIADLKYRLSVKNRVVMEHFKSMMFHIQENQQLRAEIGMLKKEGKVEVTEVTPTVD